MIPPQELVDIIRRDLDNAIVKASTEIVQNRAPDMETYCVMFGKINGLREARRAVDDLVKRINEPQTAQSQYQAGEARNNPGGQYF